MPMDEHGHVILPKNLVTSIVERVLGSVPETEYDTRSTTKCAALPARLDLWWSSFKPSGGLCGLASPRRSTGSSCIGQSSVDSGLSFSLTWDASPQGWAAVLRWWDSTGASPLLRDLLLIGSWPAEEEVAEQAHREALAAPLALEAAWQAVDLRVCFGLLRNDAQAAIGALIKGSTSSPPMQRQAVLLNRVSYRQELDLLLAHVQGLALVEEGIDGASRAGAQFGPDSKLEHVLGPRVGDGLWGSIESLEAPLGWEVTIDLFAAMVNGCVPSTCRGGCDKDLSGIVTDWHVFRFATCQFGQKTAGSPLGSIVRAGARSFARLTYPVHVAAWVDDLIVGMSTLAPRG